VCLDRSDQPEAEITVVSCHMDEVTKPQVGAHLGQLADLVVRHQERLTIAWVDLTPDATDDPVVKIAEHGSLEGGDIEDAVVGHRDSWMPLLDRLQGLVLSIPSDCLDLNGLLPISLRSHKSPDPFNCLVLL